MEETQLPGGGTRYRIAEIRPWASEGDGVPQEMRTFFEGKEVEMADLQSLAYSFGAHLDSAVQGGGRFQAVLTWRDHSYDLDLEPLS